jgi:hypothetical protein
VGAQRGAIWRMSDHSGGRARSRRLLRRGGLGGVAVLACAVVLGAAATGAFAAPATNLPAPALGPIFPGPTNGGALPAGGPGVKITGTCPQWLFNDRVGLVFSSGNAVLYQPDNSGIPGTLGLPPFDGGNVEGNAALFDGSDSTQPSYTGQAHLWFGLTYNANGQFYFGETISFRGTGTAGAISLSANPGFVTSASGHNSGWGQVTLRCS